MTNYITNIQIVIGPKLEKVLKEDILHRCSECKTFKDICLEVIAKCKKRQLIQDLYIDSTGDLDQLEPVVNVSSNPFNKRNVDFDETLDIARAILRDENAKIQYVFPALRESHEVAGDVTEVVSQRNTLAMMMSNRRGTKKLQLLTNPTTSRKKLRNDLITALQKDTNGILKMTYASEDGLRHLKKLVEVFFYLDGRMETIIERSKNNPAKVQAVPERYGFRFFFLFYTYY